MVPFEESNRFIVIENDQTIVNRRRPMETKKHFKIIAGIGIALVVVFAILIGVWLHTMANKIDLSYNELLNSHKIFPAEFEFVSYARGGDYSEVVENLHIILGNNTILHTIYHNFMKAYPRYLQNYTDADIRFFKNKLSSIALHNLQARNGLHTWEMEVTVFTDMTSKEFLENYTGFKSTNLHKASQNLTIPNISSKTEAVKLKMSVPESVDWIQKGKVSAVKYQGDCGSCVMFATASFIESAYAIKYSTNPPELSAQELLDCSQPRSDVCNTGSNYNPVLDYIQEHGLATVKDYPLQQDSLQSPCNKNVNQMHKSVFITKWIEIPKGEEYLRYFVAIAPVSTGVHMISQDYSKGVYSGCSKDAKVNHAVLVVGYGTEDGEDYWLIKNSYGKEWGDNGYFKLKRNTGECGIGTDSNSAVFVIVK